MLVNSTHSFQRITMDNIAQTAGVSKATLYKWWKCKELLFIEAFIYYTHQYLPKLQISDEMEGRFLDQCFAMLNYSAVIHKEETDEDLIRKITRMYQLIISDQKR